MLRVKEWIKFFIFIPIIGAIIAHATAFILCLVGIIFFCVIGYGFVINNYFDVELDKSNSKKVSQGKNPLSGGNVTKQGSCVLMSVLLLIPLVISYFLSLTGFIFTCLSIVCLTLYSVRHIRLKERFMLDILVHGLMFGLFPFLAGLTLAGGTVNVLILLIASLFVIISCESLLAHQIKDYHEDFGYSSTTVVRLGLSTGWAMLVFCVALSVVNLELIARSYAIGLTLNGAAFAYLIAYPLYTCRGEILTVVKPDKVTVVIERIMTILR